MASPLGRTVWRRSIPVAVLNGFSDWQLLLWMGLCFTFLYSITAFHWKRTHTKTHTNWSMRIICCTQSSCIILQAYESLWNIYMCYKQQNSQTPIAYFTSYPLLSCWAYSMRVSHFAFANLFISCVRWSGDDGRSHPRPHRPGAGSARPCSPVITEFRSSFKRFARCDWVLKDERRGGGGRVLNGRTPKIRTAIMLPLYFIALVWKSDMLRVEDTRTHTHARTHTHMQFVCARARACSLCSVCQGLSVRFKLSVAPEPHPESCTT